VAVRAPDGPSENESDTDAHEPNGHEPDMSDATGKREALGRLPQAARFATLLCSNDGAS